MTFLWWFPVLALKYFFPHMVRKARVRPTRARGQGIDCIEVLVLTTRTVFIFNPFGAALPMWGQNTCNDRLLPGS